MEENEKVVADMPQWKKGSPVNARVNPVPGELTSDENHVTLDEDVESLFE